MTTTHLSQVRADHPQATYQGSLRQAAASLFLWASLVLAADAASAHHLPEADARAVRVVVQSQIDAMAQDDGETAFSYATPEVQRKFGNPSSFMTMVRHGYPMVIRPRQVAFQRALSDNDTVIQGVYLRDSVGLNWLASYELQRQPDGSWRISGCVVHPVQSMVGI
ncbi:MAG: hypothetical protein RIQ60_1457 [Pseudomonadota bacterium]|jgi:hypothetical protein